MAKFDEILTCLKILEKVEALREKELLSDAGAKSLRTKAMRRLVGLGMSTA